MRVSRGERIKLGEKFIGVLKGFLPISAKMTPDDIDDLVSEVPFGKIISFVYGLSKIYERIGSSKEALYVALLMGALKSLEETLVEFDFQEQQIEEILEKLDTEEKKEELKRLAKPEMFTPEDLLNADSDIYRTLKDIFLSPVKEYGLINHGDFERKFREKLKLNFWRVIEKDENRFKFLLDEFNKKSYKEAYRIYRKDRYYRKTLNRFEEEAIFGMKEELHLKMFMLNLSLEFTESA